MLYVCCARLLEEPCTGPGSALAIQHRNLFALILFSDVGVI